MDFLKRSWAEIDLDAILANLGAIKKAAGERPVMAVVKADAYGHGAACVAPLLQEAGVEFFAVSNIDEAEELRFAGITAPVLILGYTPEEYAPRLAKGNISQTVMSEEYGKSLAEYAAKCGANLNVHIKLDTGMGRIGFVCRENKNPAEEIISVLGSDSLNFEGIFTHFAAADTDREYTELQTARFKATVDELSSAGYNPKYRHCSNSAGILLHPDCGFDMVRAGIILYGLTPDDSVQLPDEFCPAMSFCSAVSMVKDMEEGESISYGCTYRTKKTTRLATLPVGYADGFRRALSNRGKVLINGKKVPVVGRVCMDQTVIDVTKAPNVKVGDKVVLFGPQYPVEKVARLCGTINYEIVCGISRRVPRVYLRDGKEVFAKTYIYEEEK